MAPFESAPEIDAALDTTAVAPPMAPRPARPLDLRGLSFPSKRALLAWLRVASDSWLAGERAILVEEQEIPGPYRAYVVLSTNRLIVVQTRPRLPPEVWGAKPRLATLTATLQGHHSTLVISSAEGRLELTRLHPLAAQRIVDVARLTRFGRLSPASEIPSRIAFDGVWPIEYYEAILGPSRHREISSLAFGRHRFILEVKTGQRSGLFLVRHALSTPDGERDVDEAIAPFRSHRAHIVRERGPPYQLSLIPASLESPRALLRRHGIEMQSAPGIKERYRARVAGCARDAAVAALLAAGIPNRPGPGGFSLLRGPDCDYLQVGGKALAFDDRGESLTLEPLPAKPSAPLHSKTPPDFLHRKKPPGAPHLQRPSAPPGERGRSSPQREEAP
ncbi:MAG: hypothetical protein ACYDBQ_01165 [Thermoplasmatota archaeon]